MKFKKIIMTNFMRYKGKNELVFSCDNDKNVTIILGDNTFGKTTIAQAFRWGLYGKVKKTNYIKNIDDIVLLNNEVISLMDKGEIPEGSGRNSSGRWTKYIYLYKKSGI